jgi:hypothetical protein
MHVEKWAQSKLTRCKTDCDGLEVSALCGKDLSSEEEGVYPAL